MKKYIIWIIIGIVLIVGLLWPSNKKYLSGKVNIEISIKDYGIIELELDADNTPITVTNFVNLINEKFYDGLTIHRVIDGFMIQGGDPNKDGTGGSINKIKGEFKSNGIENKILHKRGAISMARRSDDANSATSQFFIMQRDNESLDGDYAAFGKVTSGIEVVDKIIETVASLGDSNGLIPVESQPIIEYIKII